MIHRRYFNIQVNNTNNGHQISYNYNDRLGMGNVQANIYGGMSTDALQYVVKKFRKPSDMVESWKRDFLTEIRMLELPEINGNHYFIKKLGHSFPYRAIVLERMKHCGSEVVAHNQISEFTSDSKMYLLCQVVQAFNSIKNIALFVHRDLKWSNLVIDDLYKQDMKPKVKIIDLATAYAEHNKLDPEYFNWISHGHCSELIERMLPSCLDAQSRLIAARLDVYCFFHMIKRALENETSCNDALELANTWLDKVTINISNLAKLPSWTELSKTDLFTRDYVYTHPQIKPDTMKNSSVKQQFLNSYFDSKNNVQEDPDEEFETNLSEAERLDVHLNSSLYMELCKDSQTRSCSTVIQEQVNDRYTTTRNQILAMHVIERASSMSNRLYKSDKNPQKSKFIINYQLLLKCQDISKSVKASMKKELSNEAIKFINAMDTRVAENLEDLTTQAYDLEYYTSNPGHMSIPSIICQLQSICHQNTDYRISVNDRPDESMAADRGANVQPSAYDQLIEWLSLACAILDKPDIDHNAQLAALNKRRLENC
jgi:Protein kinase domain